MSLSAQNEWLLQAEVDPANTFDLIDHKENGFNGVLTLNYRGDISQFGLFYETFPNIDFQSVGVNMYAVLNAEGKFNYMPGFQISFIDRPDTFDPSLGVLAQLQYNISDDVAVSMRGQHRMRHDVGKDEWRFSGYVGVIYKFNFKR